MNEKEYTKNNVLHCEESFQYFAVNSKIIGVAIQN